MAAAKRLSDKERAALLRAARTAIRNMERELEVLAERIRRKVPGAQVAYDMVEYELKLLSDAVRKMWTGGNGHG